MIHDDFTTFNDSRYSRVSLLSSPVVLLLGCVQEPFYDARYQPKDFYVEILSCVKKCAVREQNRCMKTFFSP